MCVRYQIKHMRKWKLVFVLCTVDHMPGLPSPCSQSACAELPSQLCLTGVSWRQGASPGATTILQWGPGPRQKAAGSVWGRLM